MTATKLMTADEFFEMDENGYKYELVRGIPVRMTPPGGWHGETSGELHWHVRNYLTQNPIGRVYVETTFRLAQHPDIVRAPDVAFVHADRLPPREAREKYLPLAPDLAVEVLSPWDRAGEVLEKVLEYLSAGTRLVWVVAPRRRTVTVHYPDRTARILTEGDELDGGDVLPGFKVAVAELFR